MIFNIVFWAVGGWFTWVAIGVTAVGAVGSMVAANQKKVPGAVQYQPVDVGKSASDAINANLDNQAKSNALISSANTFNQGQATSMMEQALPGWGKLQSSLMSTTQDLLKNPYDLPPDVQSNLERISAEKGISAGTRGQFNDFSMLRDLGVNSLQYGQSRINQAGSLSSLLASTAPRVSPMSPLSMMVTPDQAIGQQQYTNTQNQAIDQGYQNSLAELNNYKAQVMSNSFSQLSGAAMGVVGGAGKSGGGWGTTNVNQGTGAGTGGSFSTAAASGGWGF
jgi:hypothetical protein